MPPYHPKMKRPTLEYVDEVEGVEDPSYLKLLLNDQKIKSLEKQLDQYGKRIDILEKMIFSNPTALLSHYKESNQPNQNINDREKDNEKSEKKKSDEKKSNSETESIDEASTKELKLRRNRTFI